RTAKKDGLLRGHARRAMDQPRGRARDEAVVTNRPLEVGFDHAAREPRLACRKAGVVSREPAATKLRAQPQFAPPERERRRPFNVERQALLGDGPRGYGRLEDTSPRRREPFGRYRTPARRDC